MPASPAASRGWRRSSRSWPTPPAEPSRLPPPVPHAPGPSHLSAAGRAREACNREGVPRWPDVAGAGPLGCEDVGPTRPGSEDYMATLAGPGVRGPPGVAASAIEAVKRYGTGEAAVRALDGVTVSFDRGGFTAIMGPSGSGKSTLLHCLAGLDTLTEGTVLLGDVDLSTLSEKELTLLRRDRVGFIFQFFHLVPTRSAGDNVSLPLALAGREADEEWLAMVVRTLGIEDRLSHLPAELSGGQQQRVAAARALVNRPEIVFADEPTGNLDSRAGGEVLRVMRQAVDEFGQTIVMVTHDPKAASRADRIVFLSDGRIVDELAHPTAEQILEHMKGLGE